MTTHRSLFILLFGVAMAGCDRDVSGPQRTGAVGTLSIQEDYPLKSTGTTNPAVAIPISYSNGTVSYECKGNGTATITAVWEGPDTNGIPTKVTIEKQVTCHDQGGS